MPEFKIKAERAIGACTTTAALQGWLRPGSLAFIFGEHTDALRAHVVRINSEINAMANEFGKKYPDVVAIDDPMIEQEPEKYKAGEPHPMAGQIMTTIRDDGTTSTPLASPDAAKQFAARHAELMNSELSILVSERLTHEHIARIDKERLDIPRGLNGAPPVVDAIDFSALMPLIERKEYTRDGVAVSTAPSSNGANRMTSLIKES